MNFLEIYYTDVYKTGHKAMLPNGSVLMQSNLTPRSGKHSNCPNDGKVVVIGSQMTTRKMKKDWDENFFNRPIEEIDQFGKDMTDMLMMDKPFDVSHFKDLHKLGYLPLEFRSITEGERIPYKVPMTTIVNTKPLNNKIFDWLVNYLETINSAEAWQAPTSATLSFALRRLSTKWITKTDSENMWFVDYQNHDFAMRGLSGKSSIINSGIGFASSSKGGDSLPVIPATRMFYDEKEVVINSVIATEHSVTSANVGFYEMLIKKGELDDIVCEYLNSPKEEVDNLSNEEIRKIAEFATFKKLIIDNPTGILSLVSDTFDLWEVLNEYMPRLKKLILRREGKIVIRPDSGDPVDIICGYNSLDNTKDCDIDHPSFKGVVELLYDTFGGVKSKEGYVKLNEKVGVIYGDSINYDRAERIYERLSFKNFATTNVVLGVGSYSLQMVTRDTHGMAQKATYVEIEVDGKIEGIEVFKNPITDSGIKKSAKGLLKVIKKDGEYVLIDQVSWEEVNKDDNELKVIFKDGEFFNQTTFSEIRERLAKQI